MEARVTRWKRPAQTASEGSDLDAMARKIAAQLRESFGKEILQGPLLDQILRQAREMIADQVEESIGAAMFEPELVVVDDEDEEDELETEEEVNCRDFAEIARRIREKRESAGGRS